MVFKACYSQLLLAIIVGSFYGYLGGLAHARLHAGSVNVGRVRLTCHCVRLSKDLESHWLLWLSSTAPFVVVPMYRIYHWRDVPSRWKATFSGARVCPGGASVLSCVHMLKNAVRSRSQLHAGTTRRLTSVAGDVASIVC
ncbi:hypothetical protein K431DRAFT_97037 [Polychaeton citri CBS 116435]|uniref:Uncharacterized protein n=1 Tax=Polychaeton citri CBS 116435 TaxID=1314669 RepID=A0A9P4ULF0_9PEZI|nr:hypothetical protein K431DRAFT_97037 [Polychaeton citri CBS 116435]